MNIKIIESYIKEYKNEFDSISKEELYKWKAVKQFQDTWNIDASDFHLMLKTSLSSVNNLMAARNYFPKRMLLKNIEKEPEKIRNLFRKLYDEDEDILERVELFRANFKKLNKQNFTVKNDYQDHRAVIVYLTLRYPERYFFYKFNMFRAFSEKIGYGYKPSKGKIKNIGQFQTLCNLVKHHLSEDQELLKLHKNRISNDCYYDENLHILTQDFIYAVSTHLIPSSIERHVEPIETIPTTISSSQIQIALADINFTPSITNHIQNNINNKRIGDLGELWVLDFEKQKLLNAQKPKLAEKVQHVAKELGDGLGYDILSFDINGNKIFIEVKTTKGKVNSTFYITRHELEKSIIEKDNFYLYRVFNFNEKIKTAELQKIKGELINLCEVPIIYKVNIKTNSL